jgi:hypothetical protein
VASLLRELLHDALQRADDIVESLAALDTGGSAEVAAYRGKMTGLATHARQLIEGLLADPDIDKANYSTNYFREYCHFARLLRGLEDLPLLVLKRFNETDQQATHLMTAICNETGYPYQSPICSAISSQYFWTMPDMDLVFIPCLEPDHVLGLPDIYHELGHILLFRDRVRLEYPALTIVDDHYDRLRSEGKRLNWPTASVQQLEQFQHNWRRSWLLEFASDLIATYLIGPSFGWCNIRTATNLGGELYVGTETHPADDARATAIGMMLTEIGFDDSSQRIQSRWSELIQLAVESPPPRYELAFPQKLLEDLTQFFRTECEGIGLQRFSTSDGCPVATTIHDCWSQFRAKPETYVSYERKALEELLAQLRN